MPKLAADEEVDHLSIDERPGTRHSGNGIYEISAPSPPQYALRPLFACGTAGEGRAVRALHALRIDRLLIPIVATPATLISVGGGSVSQSKTAGCHNRGSFCNSDHGAGRPDLNTASWPLEINFLGVSSSRPCTGDRAKNCSRNQSLHLAFS
jgi:hypothetical protein